MGRRNARQKINREMKHKTKKMGRRDQDKKKRGDRTQDKKKGETRRKREKMER